MQILTRKKPDCHFRSKKNRRGISLIETDSEVASTGGGPLPSSLSSSCLTTTLGRMTHDLLARPLLRKALQFAGITSRELMDRLGRYWFLGGHPVCHP